ncbi:MAG: hypothetical protein SNF86_06740 [Rikenellaceae bacterium]
MEIILLTTATIIFFGYIIVAIACGVFDSISQSHYLLANLAIKADKEELTKIFTAWCFTIALLINYPLMVATAGTTWGQWCVLTLCLGFAGVGLTPEYGDSKYTYWHYGFAAVIGLSSIAIGFAFGLWWGAGILAALVASLVISCFTTKHDWIMCIEVGAGFALLLETYIMIV